MNDSLSEIQNECARIVAVTVPAIGTPASNQHQGVPFNLDFRVYREMFYGCMILMKK